MPTIQWEDSYSVNHLEIDNQHKKWIEIFNELHHTLINGAPEELGSVGCKSLEKMVDYAKYHFSFEEDYMKIIGYPAIVEHRRLHKDFDNVLFQYSQDACENQVLVLNTDILRIIKKWLLSHILVEDKKYSEFAAASKK